MNTVPPEVLWKVINLMAYTIGALFTIGISVFAYFHRSLIRRLDTIDADIKPIRTEIALNEQRLNAHHDDINDLKHRVSKLEQNKKGD